MHYQVTKTIHLGLQGSISRGTVLQDPDWPNLKSLLESGYIKRCDPPGETPVEPGGSPDPVVELEVAHGAEGDIAISAQPEMVADGRFYCRYSDCTKYPDGFESKRARTGHEIRAHGKPHS